MLGRRRHFGASSAAGDGGGIGGGGMDAKQQLVAHLDALAAHRRSSTAAAQVQFDADAELERAQEVRREDVGGLPAWDGGVVRGRLARMTAARCKGPTVDTPDNHLSAPNAPCSRRAPSPFCLAVARHPPLVAWRRCFGVGGPQGRLLPATAGGSKTSSRSMRTRWLRLACGTRGWLQRLGLGGVGGSADGADRDAGTCEYYGRCGASPPFKLSRLLHHARHNAR